MLATAAFHESLDRLHCVDWSRLRARDFRRDNEDLEKVERYQAEALIYGHLPIDMLEVIVCNRLEETVKTRALVDTLGADVTVSHSPHLYF